MVVVVTTYTFPLVAVSVFFAPQPEREKKNTAEINLKSSENGISPGQACVFYKKDEFGYKVLGGGWIKS